MSGPRPCTKVGDSLGFRLLLHGHVRGCVCDAKREVYESIRGCQRFGQAFVRLWYQANVGDDLELGQQVAPRSERPLAPATKPGSRAYT